MVCLALALAPSCAALSCSRILSAPKMWLKGQFPPNSRQTERDDDLPHVFSVKRSATQNSSQNAYFGKRVFFDIPMSLRMINRSTHSNFRSMRSQRMGYKKEITIPKVPLTFQAWYHENGWFWFAGKSTRDTFFFCKPTQQIAAGKSAFLWHVKNGVRQVEHLLCPSVEMSELCDDHACSVNLRVMEMMGDDPNIINVWWADKQMNDDQHPAISGYWLTWSFTKPLYSWLRKVLCFFRRFWVKKKSTCDTTRSTSKHQKCLYHMAPPIKSAAGQSCAEAKQSLVGPESCNTTSFPQNFGQTS